MASSSQHMINFILNAQQNAGFGAVFSKAQQQFSRLGKEIQNLNKLQSNISAYQAQQTAIEKTEQKLQKLRQIQDLTNQQMKSASADALPGLQAEYLRLDMRIGDTTAALDRQKQKLADTGAKLKDAGVDLENLGGKSAELIARIKELEQEQEKAAEGAQTFGEKAAAGFAAAGQALAAAGVLEGLRLIGNEMAKNARAAMEYETAMAGVRRTVGGSVESVAALGEGFRELSMDIPATTSELATIAETAGQLGIARDRVSGFTEVMAKLSTTTDLTSDAAATMLAQFANITGTEDYQRLGSTVAELGDATATTASKVVEMSQGLAAAANLAGMAETDILAIAASVGSLGIEAQAGSTAMSTLISTLYKAVETGKGLENFAAVAGMTAAEFKTAWGRDAAGALDAFIQGLDDTERNGRSAIVILDELGITNVRQTKAILGLASAEDLLSRTLAQAGDAWEENTALQEKAGIMYATTESRLKMMQNAGTNLRVTLGEQFAPELRLLIETGTNVLGVMNAFVQANPALVKGLISLAAAAGTAAAGIATVSAAVKVLKVLNLAAVFASPAGPAVIAATAVGGLAATVLGVAAGAREGAPAVREQTQAARDMGQTIEEAAAAYGKTAEETLAAANVADTYIAKLESMGNYAGLSAEKQREYHDVLSLLCETVPELADSIDLETNTISGGTAALRVNTEAWKQNAMAQAMQDRLSALYAAQADALLEVEKNRIKLTEAQVKADGIEARRMEALQRMNQLSKEAQQSGEALPAEYYDLQNALVDLGREYRTAEATARAYETAMARGSAAAAEAEAEIALETKAVKTLSGVLADTSGADAQTEAMAELNAALLPIQSQLELLSAAYDETYEAALSSMEGQYALWDKAAEVVPTSAAAINAALESQAKYWQDYNRNIQTVLDNAGDIAGLHELLAGLDAGDANTVNFVAGLAQASKSDKRALEEMVRNWQEAQKAQEEAAGSFSQYASGLAEEMGGLQEQVKQAVEDMDLSAEAAESARNTIQAYIDQTEAMKGSLRSAFAGLWQGALDTLPAVPAVVPASNSGNARTKMRPGRGYAAGTLNAAPGWAWVGEEGSELFRFSGGEQVLNARQSAAFSAELAPAPVGGSPQVQVNFNIAGSAAPETVQDLRTFGDEIISRVLDAMENEQADRARRAIR